MSWLGIHAAVRGVIVANIPEGFVLDTRRYIGMDTWVVAAERSPKTYDGRPAPIVAVGERKSYVSLFLMGIYYDPTMADWLDTTWLEESGSRIDRGRVTVRMRNLDDVPLDVVAEAVSRLSVDDVVAFFDRWNAGIR